MAVHNSLQTQTAIGRDDGTQEGSPETKGAHYCHLMISDVISVSDCKVKTTCSAAQQPLGQITSLKEQRKDLISEFL
jgi:hypothetical protein